MNEQGQYAAAGLQREPTVAIARFRVSQFHESAGKSNAAHSLWHRG